MRILHLIPALAAGGAERLLADLLTPLQSYAVQEVAVIHPAWLYPDFFLTLVQATGVPVTYLNKPVGKSGRVLLVWRYWRLLQRFKPDIIHASQWDAMDLARVFHRYVSTTPVVGVAHDLIVGDHDHSSHERRFAGWAEVIITVSNVTAQSYEQYAPGNHLITIEDGVNLSYFAPGEQAVARQKLGFEPDQFIFLLPARFTTFKNHKILVEAVQHLVSTGQWNERAIVICAGYITDQELYHEIKTYVEDHHLEAVINLMEPQTDVVTLYQACDVGLLISKYEALGLAGLEMAACERPVIVSDMVNHQGAFRHGENGWVVPAGDVIALAQTMVSAMQLSATERNQMGKLARTHFPHHLTLEHTAQRYLEVFQQVAAGKR